MEKIAEKRELRVESEFRDKIPPLTADEFKQLEANILEDGEVYEPIAVWNGVIIDGHNRWKIVQAHPEIPYKVREMDFPDKWAAFEWMYKKQLGRRNLTEQQRTYMIGKMYEARKKSVGNTTTRRNADGTFQCTQNGNIGTQRVSEQIADELGIAKNTVIRGERFSKGVDALREVSPEAADAILSGDVKISKKDVSDLARAEHEQVKQAAEAIENGEPLPAKTTEQNASPSKRPSWMEFDFDEDRPPYSIDNLVEEIEANGEDLERGLRIHISTRAEFISDETARNRVENAIGIIIEHLKIFKEEIHNGEYGQPEHS